MQNKKMKQEKPEPYLTYVYNLLHSLFSNCGVFINITMLYLLAIDIVMKNCQKNLICIRSLIERIP